MRITFLLIISITPVLSTTIHSSDSAKFTTTLLTENSPKEKPVINQLFDSTLCQGFVDPFTGTKSTNTIRFQNSNYPLKKTIILEETKAEEVWSCNHTSAIQNQIVLASGHSKIVSLGKRNDEYFIINEYTFVENGSIKKIQIETYPLDTVYVKLNQQVKSKEKLGKISSTATQIKFTTFFTNQSPFFKKNLSWYLKEYYQLTVPAKESTLLIAEKSKYTIQLFKNGNKISNYDICLGQSPNGHKEQEGDNRTPEGEYRITEKEKGPFYGGTGPYLGDRWMHFSYPNQYDAELGYQRGIISKTTRDAIINDDKAGKKTNSYTKLGGRVGLHGWNGKFYADGTQNLTWGCVCMQNEDIIKLFEQVPMNCKLIILP